ncbi:MAG: phosphate signaling complex protein PhoU [Chloroflexi bacterium]|nr:phosphate signaling complex protein PhoU [Chloroflexota bacterium]
MPNEQLDYSLAHLEAEIVLLGGLVENAIFKTIRALRNRDLELSREVIEEDDRIDDLETKIQNECVEQIRRQAPLAADLRRIIGMMFIANELERMGDYAEGIAKVSINMGHEAPLKELEDIPKMADLAVSMMKRSIDAMTTSDRDESARIALEIENDDDEVDRLYAKVQNDIFTLVEDDRERAVRGTYLMWAAHNVERVADRATNIAERAIFMSTGVIVSGNADAQAAVLG